MSERDICLRAKIIGSSAATSHQHEVVPLLESEGQAGLRYLGGESGQLMVSGD